MVKIKSLTFMCLLLLPSGLLAQESKASPQQGGRYQVVNTKAAVLEMAILVDTATGKTWRLAPAGSGQTAWMPITRLDTSEEVREWIKSNPPVSKK